MPRGGKRQGAGREPKPLGEKKVKLTIGFEPEVAVWLRSQRNYNRLMNELVKQEMSEPMSIQFKPGERAKFYTEIAGLSEIMAGFIRHLSPGLRQQAISKVDNIHLFLTYSTLKTTTIHRFESNDYGFSIAAEMLGKKKEAELQIGFQELEALWTEITENWWSHDQWLALKMSLHTRLPGTKHDTDVDSALDRNSQQKAQEFRDQLRAENAKIEARIDDPAYWEQIRKDIAL